MERFDLQIIEKKKDHFLNEWNMISAYDTSRLFFIILIAGMFLPMLSLFVICCSLIWILLYHLFKSYRIIGTITFNDEGIIIRTDNLNEDINYNTIDEFILTYKTRKNSITNKNRQTENNWIHIVTNSKKYRLNFIFKNNSNLYDCIEYLNKKRKEIDIIRLINFAGIKIDDLICK